MLPRNDAWAGYGGGTLYTRSKTISPEILERVREATAKAKVPYDKFWKAGGILGWFTSEITKSKNMFKITITTT